MSNIKKAFENGKAFVAFITCGFPNLDVTEQIIYEMVENGADLIELGIPFSDPTAEGPVIQNANYEALKNGVTTDKIFDLVEKVRKKTDIPLVFMTYANVVFSYGIEKFVKKSAELKMDGLILPDIPFEEKKEFSTTCEQYGLDFISLISPNSNERVEMIAKDASGFIYCVSSLGVTGVRANITTDLEKMVADIKKHTSVPCAIGFGISNEQQAKEMSQYADGVIVGSAIIQICNKYGEESPKYVGEYIKKMKDSIR